MNKTVVITGASSGIGKACALHFDSQGWQVFAGVRKKADAVALRQIASSRLIPLFMDLLDEESIAAAAKTVAQQTGEAGLSGLVNNAGIVVAGPLEFLPLAELRHQMEINVIGQVAVTQAFLPLLRQGQGRIINMGSISGRMASPLLGPYAASKFALEALTDSLRVELKRWQVEVVIIEPGAIATPIWEKSAAKGRESLATLSEEGHKRYGNMIKALFRRAEEKAQTATPVDKVVQAVAHALMASRPKTRYVVGRDAFAGILLAKFMPDRWRDWLLGGRRKK